MRERVRQRSQGQTEGAVSVEALWQAEGRDCCRNSQEATEAGAERARESVSQGHGGGEPAGPGEDSGFKVWVPPGHWRARAGQDSRLNRRSLAATWRMYWGYQKHKPGDLLGVGVGASAVI